jgi:uncharacterized protein YecE (DUF72 family)
MKYTVDVGLRFKFTAKFPRVPTHEKRLDRFFEVIGILSSKGLPLLVQLVCIFKRV